MKQRCSNPNCRDYPNYGEKGVSVCTRWHNSFEDFLKDVGERPAPKMSLDRFPNPEGNYEPSNVRWGTDEMQANNKTNNHKITLNGLTLTLIEWSRKLGFGRNTIYYRLSKGWSEVDALTVPVVKRPRKTLTKSD